MTYQTFFTLITISSILFLVLRIYIKLSKKESIINSRMKYLVILDIIDILRMIVFLVYVNYTHNTFQDITTIIDYNDLFLTAEFVTSIDFIFSMSIIEDLYHYHKDTPKA